MQSLFRNHHRTSQKYYLPVLVQDIAEKGECQKNADGYPSGLNCPERDFQKKEAEDEKKDSVYLEAAYGRNKDNKKDIKKDLYLREQGLS
jgi:hypothetical protein